MFYISAMDDRSKKVSRESTAAALPPVSDSLSGFSSLPLQHFFTLLAPIPIKLAPRVLIAVYEGHLLPQEFFFLFFCAAPSSKAAPLQASLRFLCLVFFLLSPLISVVCLHPFPSSAFSSCSRMLPGLTRTRLCFYRELAFLSRQCCLCGSPPQRLPFNMPC